MKPAPLPKLPKPAPAKAPQPHVERPPAPKKRRALPRHRRDLWDFSEEGVVAEAWWYLEAALHAGIPFGDVAATIEVSEEERRGLEFLQAHRIIHESKMEQVIERRREIREKFEELVREHGARIPREPESPV